MEGLKPRSRSDVLIRSIRNQTVLDDNVSKTQHVLNETAEFIWNLCDGEHTVAQIAQEVRLAFDVPEDADVEADIERALSVLTRKGLLAVEGTGRDDA